MPVQYQITYYTAPFLDQYISKSVKWIHGSNCNGASNRSISYRCGCIAVWWWTIIDITWNDIQMIVIPSNLSPWGTNNVWSRCTRVRAYLSWYSCLSRWDPYIFVVCYRWKRMCCQWSNANFCFLKNPCFAFWSSPGISIQHDTDHPPEAKWFVSICPSEAVQVTGCTM